MQKKIRDAEKDWIPYIIVIGQREINEKILSVRDRSFSYVGKKGKIRVMTFKQIIEEIKQKTADKPFKPLSLPMNISERPIFYG